MKGRFRLKVMLSYLLLVVLLGAGLYGYLSFNLENSIASTSREHLQDEVRVASLMASKEIGDLRRDAPALTAALSKALRARVTVIDPGGVVVADSEVAPEELPRLENHRNRPEVRQAARSGVGSSMRYSATLHTNMLYVAAPFGSGDMIRLALPLSEIEQAKERLQKSLAAVLAFGLLVTLLLSYLLSNVTSRYLSELASVASRIGRGEFGLRVPVRSSDEVGELARVMNDMTARIQQQMDRISSEKKRLDTILKGMGEGVMVTDREGVVTLVNPAFCGVFGSETQVLGRQLLEISRHPDLYEACREVLADRRERHQEINLPGGQAMLVHWVPLLEAEFLRGVVAVFHDISDLKRTERIRRDFVANVSHELRTPVSVIKGYAETLLANPLDDDPQRRERFLAIIQGHADRLSALIGDLLTLSQFESGGMQLQRRNLSLEQALKHALFLMERKAEEKGITLECRVAAAAACVAADGGRLEQVLINLLDNAVKYSGDGGRIVLEVDREGEMVRISVKDSGIGIPQQDLPRLFERFYRVDAARSRDQGGTGLGLSIVKHIVQAHGGSVHVESRPGEGSTFSFTLPAGETNG